MKHNDDRAQFTAPGEIRIMRTLPGPAERIWTYLTDPEKRRRWFAGGTRGSVLSVITTWVWTGSPFVVPSAMSKAGIDAMTKSLAVEWGRYGIRLNAVAPGVFPTEGAEARLRPGGDGYSKELAENPMRRHGRMSELTDLTAFLMAPNCEWLTGQTIAIDGAKWLATGAYFTQNLDWTDEQWQQARERIQVEAQLALRDEQGSGNDADTGGTMTK